MSNTLEKGLINFERHEKGKLEKCFGGKMISSTDEDLLAREDDMAPNSFRTTI